MIGSNLLKKSIAEFIGSFALVFAGCGAIMVHSLHPEILSSDGIPVVFGLVVAAMVYAVGHISGAHLNPAVTIAFTVAKRFPIAQLPAYLTSQLIGGVLGIFTLSITLPEVANYGSTLPSISIFSAFIWEFILTFLLMFVIISVATDSRAVGIMAGAAIGATVMLDAFIGGALTGASMNPARSIAPALFSGQFETLWIYIVAPISGAILAVIIYDFIRCETEDKKQDVKGCC